MTKIAPIKNNGHFQNQLTKKTDMLKLAVIFFRAFWKLTGPVLKNDIKVTHEDRIKEQTTARDDNRGKNTKVISPNEFYFRRLKI